MKNKIIFNWHLLLVICLYFPSKAQNQDFDWVKPFNTSGGISILTDRSGNVYSFGNFYGTTDFDPGPGTYTLSAQAPNGSYVCKLDSAGNFLWAKAVTSSLDMKLDKRGNMYFIGTYSDTLDVDPGPSTYTLAKPASGQLGAFILKLNSFGNFLWAKSFAGSDNYDCVAYSISLDSLQNVYTTGAFGGATVDFDPDSTTTYILSSHPRQPDAYSPLGIYYYNFFLSKLDSNGKFVFAKSLSAPNHSSGQAMINNANEILAVGRISSGENEDSSALFVTKYNVFGSTLWSKIIHGTIYHPSITTDLNNNICIVGNFDNTIDFDPGAATFTLNSNYSTFVLKLDPSGNFLWANKRDLYINTYDQNPPFYDYDPNIPPSRIIAADSSGNIYVAGSFYGPTQFDLVGQSAYIGQGAYSGFILKLSPTGSFEFVKQFGENETGINVICEISSLTFDKFGSLYTVGTFIGTVDFDPDYGVSNLMSPDVASTFVHKLNKTQLITGIKTQAADEGLVQIFPNPTADMVYVRVNKSLEQATFKLIDISGRVVQENKSINGITFALNLSEQAKGIYVLEISDMNTLARMKVIKN